VRIPLGIVAGVICLAFWMTCFGLETAVAIVAIPVMAISGNRTHIKKSWLSTYPNSSPIVNTIEAWRKIGVWVVKD
jgi:hypothetical protein